MAKQKQSGFRPFVRLGEQSEINRQPSLTEPQQVTPLERILQHRNQGIPVPIFNGVFSPIDTPDIFKMDPIERAELLEATREGIELAKQDLHAITKAQEALSQPKPSEEVPQEKPQEVSPK